MTNSKVILTAEQRDDLISCMWDGYKDIHGIRPRWIDYDVYLDPKNDFLIKEINPALGFNDCEKIKLVEQQNDITVHVLNKEQLTWTYIKTLL